MPDALIRHRRPEFEFPREIAVEDGARFTICWNGTAGAYAPFDDFDIDYENPLRPQEQIWWLGHPRQMFGGGFGDGGWGDKGGPGYPDLGFGLGGWAAGPYGVGASYFKWKFDFDLRDGDYQLAMPVCDSVGNFQSAPDQIVSFRVIAKPRPPTRFRITSYDSIGLVLNVDWKPSPEFA